MSDSAFSRFWDSVKPGVDPNAHKIPLKVIEMRRRQRRLIAAAIAVVLGIGASILTYSYITGAPERADQEFQAGMKLMSPGKYQDAVEHFNRALSINSQLPNAYLERGNAQRMLGDTNGALADFQAAADLNPILAEAHSGIAMIYIERKDLTHALEHLNKSISLKPTVEAFYQRGQIYESQGQHEKAIADFDRAIAEDRDSPYMYLARALAKTNLGDAEGARADRETASKLEGRR